MQTHCISVSWVELRHYPQPCWAVEQDISRVPCTSFILAFPKSECLTLQFPGFSSVHAVPREHERDLLYSHTAWGRVNCAASEPPPGMCPGSAVTRTMCAALTQTLTYSSSISLMGLGVRELPGKPFNHSAEETASGRAVIISG